MLRFTRLKTITVFSHCYFTSSNSGLYLKAIGFVKKIYCFKLGGSNA